MSHNFTKVLTALGELMESQGAVVHPQRWQSLDVSKDPSALMVELLHVDLEAKMPSESLEPYQRMIKPNLPWADDHFLERVGGQPLNPGVEWANWPWSNSANGHRDKNGQFNHNYMERYWPKYAGLSDEGKLPGGLEGWDKLPALRGIRERYGDLKDLVELLSDEPSTRQAYLPVWFPEDTGMGNNGRKPCSLGYHFIMRNNNIDITYYIRSCDFYRHFRDDIYLTVLLLLWVLGECKTKNPQAWGRVKPGTFRMKITSLHMFINDYLKEYSHDPYK